MYGLSAWLNAMQYKAWCQKLNPAEKQGKGKKKEEEKKRMVPPIDTHFYLRFSPVMPVGPSFPKIMAKL